MKYSKFINGIIITKDFPIGQHLEGWTRGLKPQPIINTTSPVKTTELGTLWARRRGLISKAHYDDTKKTAGNIQDNRLDRGKRRSSNVSLRTSSKMAIRRI